MSQAYTGEIRFVGFDFEPAGWLCCNGQSVRIGDYQALFAVIGTTYGGDGVQSFQLPKLNGRGLVGTGTNQVTSSKYVIGQKGGAEKTTLTASNLPLHTHAASFTVTQSFSASASIAVNSGSATQPSPANAFLAASCKTGRGGTPDPFNTYAAPTSTSAKLGGVRPSGTPGGIVTVDFSGAPSPVPVATLPPLVVGQYIICFSGLFPSHS